MLVYVLPSGRMLDSGRSRRGWDFVVIQISARVVGHDRVAGMDGPSATNRAIATPWNALAMLLAPV
jgi:hypothetical protein